jgi:hypothetical protein
MHVDAASLPTHPSSSLPPPFPNSPGSARPPSILGPPRVTSFDLRRSCANSSSLLPIAGLATPLIIRLPRDPGAAKAAFRTGPAVTCVRDLMATYNITCGSGPDAAVVQVRVFVLTYFLCV